MVLLDLICRPLSLSLNTEKKEKFLWMTSTAEQFYPNQRVYFSAAKGWSLGKIVTVSQQDGKAEVRDDASGQSEKFSNLSLLHGFIDNCYDGREPELFKIGDLHVAPLLFCLKERFEVHRQQYSRMGEMILSVNPFQPMAFNAEAAKEEYLSSGDPLLLQPHVWQIAYKAFTQIVVRHQGNQSVVISGESGSGKTENTKNLINFLGSLSFKHSCNAMQKEVADRVADSLKWSNPILESFGNARTVRNDNSSRFGKYTKLFFDTHSGVMVGGEMVTYLLEKSRIIYCGKGERNYHVFYEMLAGLSAAEKKELGGLRSAKDYKSLNRGETFTRRGVDGQDVDDAKEFATLRHAFGKMGLGQEQQWSVIKVLAAILHLQDLTFKADANDKAMIADDAPLTLACQLLGVPATAIKPCFLERSKTKILTSLATKTEAEGLRDAFCKGLYVGLFDHLVGVVNEAIRPRTGGSSTTTSSYKYIGVLDIFGFENFAVNSFEQLCINFANETLQNHYNKFTFLNDEEECRQEGIECPKITFPNNQPCLNMFDQAKSGIFALLDEECNFKGGTSQRFTNNVWDQWTGKCEYFVRPKGTVPTEFSVKHYACQVNYTTTEWLEKNGDALKDEAKLCIQQSTDAFIRPLLDQTETVSSDGVAKKRVTVAGRFQKQLQSLRTELESTESHFVRCVKPNMLAQAGLLDNMYVGSQLESAGVLQTISLKRQGYPVRRLHNNFSAYFYVIAPRSALKLHQQKKYGECAAQILKYYLGLYRWSAPHFAVGNSKVFLRAHIWSKLEKLALRKKTFRMRCCLPYLRQWAKKFRLRKAEEERRRAEQQRLLQEAAKHRAQQQSSDVVAAASSGLSSDKGKWFTEFAGVFPLFDLAVIHDVTRQAGSKELAFEFLSGMQAQRLDDTIPATLMLIFDEIGVRKSIIEALAARGITSLQTLSQLCERQLRDEFGMNEEEVRGITRKLLSMESDRVVHHRLVETVGAGGLDNLLHTAKALDKKAPSSLAGQSQGQQQPSRQQPGLSGAASPPPPATTAAATGPDPRKVQHLVDMGFMKMQAVHALQKCNEDVAKAINMLVSLERSVDDAPRAATTRPPSSSNRQPAPASQPPAQQVAVPARPAMPPAPAALPVARPVPASLDGPVMGVVVRPQAPPVAPSKQPQPPQPASAKQPAPPTAPGGPVIDVGKVNQLVDIGFTPEQAMRALQATNGDVARALDVLLQG